ncbi:hypothetical protein EWM64_g4283 [Hericium alpestre]|uniref:Uncharacterized protein n=1 Tax=Hericium alpestre TaxID=135208 RepID=A0A4Z0A1M5_9AGAM|nr:hypothetical protein EWM64_g4283 [Hericium alpestre]
MTKFSSMRLRLRSDINEHPANAIGLYKCTQAEIKAGTDAKKAVKHARTRAQHEELACKQQLEGDSISQLAMLKDDHAREDLEEAVCDDRSSQSAEEDEEEDEEADDLPSPVEDESEHDVESDIPMDVDVTCTAKKSTGSRIEQHQAKSKELHDTVAS